MVEKQIENDVDDVAEKPAQKKVSEIVSEEEFDDDDELGENDLDEIEED